MLVLSRLHPKKNLDLLLDVFLDVTSEAEFKHWRLVMAGEGDSGYVCHLKRMLVRREGENRILFTGWLYGPEKTSALKGAELLALPSRQENFGLSVVEGLACGVPVLISQHVNLADEIQSANAGWVVNLERGALAKTLAEILRSQVDRASRGAAGQKLVRSRFTWLVVTAELSSLYRSVTTH